MRNLVELDPEEDMCLPINIGRTIRGEEYIFNLAYSSHLLITGERGNEITTLMNVVINSLMEQKSPTEVKFVLMDPKGDEYHVYEKIRKQYLAVMHGKEDESAIIKTWQQARDILHSLIMECQSRKELIKKARCQDLWQYNKKVSNQSARLPYIIVIIDEFSDFMIRDGQEIEQLILQLTSRCDSCGIHLVLATGRPYENIITKSIRARFKTRIALSLSTLCDKRNIVDIQGADTLLAGFGDMLYYEYGTPRHVLGYNLTPNKIAKYVDSVVSKSYDGEQFTLPFYETQDEESSNINNEIIFDTKITAVGRWLLVWDKKSCSVNSLLKNTPHIGVERAITIINQLELIGIIGPTKGASNYHKVITKDLSELYSIFAQYKIKVL